jgi:hypothetical protein
LSKILPFMSPASVVSRDVEVPVCHANARNDNVELMARRLVVDELRAMDLLVRGVKTAVERAPESPRKDDALFVLRIALEMIDIEFSHGLSAANMLLGQLAQT